MAQDQIPYLAAVQLLLPAGTAILAVQHHPHPPPTAQPCSGVGKVTAFRSELTGTLACCQRPPSSSE